jgi:NADH-quinone oxidoreductase subunit A
VSAGAEFCTFLAAICVLVGVMVGVSWGLGPRRRVADKYPFESGVLPAHGTDIRFPAQFFLVAMFFVIFDLEMVFVFAWALVVRPAGWGGYAGMMVFLALLLVALAYLWRSGGLDWGPKKRQVRSSFFEKKEPKKLLVTAGGGTGVATARSEQKFFASFFQKRSSSLPRSGLS